MTDPLTIAKLWLLIKPVKRLKARRKRRKGMALDLGTRTSTNTAVGAPILGTVYVNLVQMLPYESVVAALTTPEMVVLATALFAWVVARFTRTPKDPGVL
jgi:hypothetical protein